MNARHLFITVTIVSLLFGVGLMFTPGLIGELYLTNPAWLNAGAILLAQGWGALLIGTAVACWSMRHDGPSVGRRAMLLLLVVFNVGLAITQSMAVLNGIETRLGWLQVALAVVVGGWAGVLVQQRDTAVA